jgi:hypothetical protein
MDKPAILFAANPSKFKARSGVSAAVGMIDAHVAHIKTYGAVFWDVVCKSPDCYDPILEQVRGQTKTGYIYESRPVKAIRFKCDIEYIKTMREILKMYGHGEDKYIPEFRSYLRKEQGYYLIKMTDITRLKERYTCSHFKKLNAEPLKRDYVVGYDIVIDPNYQSMPYNPEPKKQIDEIVVKCIQDGNYSEKDIGNVFEITSKTKNWKIWDRESPVEGGLIDFAFENTHGLFYAIELKKDADITALDQLEGYMEKVRAEFRPKKMKGVILCHSFDPLLKKAIKEEQKFDIQIKKFRFLVDFDSL